MLNQHVGAFIEVVCQYALLLSGWERRRNESNNIIMSMFFAIPPFPANQR